MKKSYILALLFLCLGLNSGQLRAQTSDTWDGLYVYTALDWYNSSYSLELSTDSDGFISGTLTGSGKDVYYKMKCTCEDLDELLVVKYIELTDGVYWEEDKLEETVRLSGNFPVLFSFQKLPSGKLITEFKELSVPESTLKKNGGVLFEKIEE